MQLWTSLERAAELWPHKVAVVDGERRTDYASLRARSAALALALRELGVGAGDRVSILAWNGQAFLEAYFAAALLGAALNPLNVRLVARETREILDDCGSKVLLAQSSFAPLVAEILAQGSTCRDVLWIDEREPERTALARGRWLEPLLDLERARALRAAEISDDALAHLYYTSGTTGRSKGVMLSHRNVGVHALATIAELSLSDRDTWAHIAPMFHLADAWATFAITWVGGTHVMLPRFEAGAALELLERERVTLTNLIPTMLNAMVKHDGARGRDYRALRLILSGGAPIAPAVVRAIVDVFGCEYVQTYGMTETSPYLTLSLLKGELLALPPAEQLAYRCKTGRPFLAVELRVVGDDGRDVPRDERAVGEIWVRGDTVTRGYWNRPDETRAAFQDGWLRTGDLAVIDTHGYVTIVDRRKDMILSGGENVYSTEVENVLYAIPGVLEAAVYGLPDATWGERVCAAIVPREGVALDAAAIEAACRRELAGYKVPRQIEFLDALPRTGTGKIAKRMLRDRIRPPGG